jgi:hypothetical protein
VIEFVRFGKAEGIAAGAQHHGSDKLSAADGMPADDDVPRRLAKGRLDRWAGESLSLTHYLCDHPVLAASLLQEGRIPKQEVRRRCN